uniref:Uncharacterized protein n=1 Tax=Syphacia muris TaxID=451379 RepID=A0A0N5AGZ1_9BILA
MLSYRVKVIRSAYALAEVATRSRQPFSSKSNFVPPSQKKLEKTDEIHHDTPADVLESAKNDIKCKSAECSDRWFTNKSRRNNPSVPDAAKRKADEYYYRYPRENEDIDRKQHNISVESNPTRGVGYAGAEATRNQKLMDLDPYRAEIPYEGRTLRPEVMNKCGKADKYQKKVKHFWNR